MQADLAGLEDLVSLEPVERLVFQDQQEALVFQADQDPLDLPEELDHKEFQVSMRPAFFLWKNGCFQSFVPSVRRQIQNEHRKQTLQQVCDTSRLVAWEARAGIPPF